jgi:hypothetical protein
LKEVVKMKNRVLIALVMVAVLCLLAFSPQTTQAEIYPDTVRLTLAPGDTISIKKIVTITGVIPKGDILFSFDLTGSMSDEIDVIKDQAYNIMVAISGLVTDAQFGVISYMDYPNYYDTCGYAATYGSAGSGDYAYSLDQSLTSDTALVRTVIEGLVMGSGVDGPQDYERIFFESYADSANIGYRPGAKRILINFGDCVPHDCNLSEGIEPGVLSTGSDPGRDEIMTTADDLDLQDVLAGMATHEVSLLEVHGNSNCGYLNYWEYWCALTGGAFFLLGDASQIPGAVDSLIRAQALHIDSLYLKEMTPGYEAWLASVYPPYYLDITAPDSVRFVENITVPLGTPCGTTHIFQISAIGDGASYGDETVIVQLPPCFIPVNLDIKPTSCPNPFNMKDKGVLPVAILGTEDFNVKTIDPATVKLEGVAPLRWNYEDVTTPVGPDPDPCECTTAGADGYRDLTLKFDHQAIAAALGTVTDREVRVLTITGFTRDGVAIQGMDCVIILKKGSSAKLSGEIGFSLSDNYPNPFNPETEISFSLPERNQVSLVIYNILGKKVKTLVNGEMEAGTHTVSWNGKDEAGNQVASGIYFYKLSAGELTATKKMVLTK